MDIKIEQRCMIKFCERLGKSVTETIKIMKEAYQDECMNNWTIYQWHKEILHGRKSASIIHMEDNTNITNRRED